MSDFWDVGKVLRELQMHFGMDKLDFFFSTSTTVKLKQIRQLGGFERSEMCTL